jgi:hypothetical protein
MPGERIVHARGLRQGDHFSPMVLLLVMEVLGALIRKAGAWGVFKKLPDRAMHRASLYAYGLIVFLSLVPSDLELIKVILTIFGGASGLCCNMSKSEITAICCSEEDIGMVDQLLPCRLSQFPIRYLGIPLSVTKLLKLAF